MQTPLKILSIWLTQILNDPKNYTETLTRFHRKGTTGKIQLLSRIRQNVPPLPMRQTEHPCYLLGQKPLLLGTHRRTRNTKRNLWRLLLQRSRLKTHPHIKLISERKIEYIRKPQRLTTRKTFHPRSIIAYHLLPTRQYFPTRIRNSHPVPYPVGGVKPLPF